MIEITITWKTPIFQEGEAAFLGRLISPEGEHRVVVRSNRPVIHRVSTGPIYFRGRLPSGRMVNASVSVGSDPTKGELNIIERFGEAETAPDLLKAIPTGETVSASPIHAWAQDAWLRLWVFDGESKVPWKNIPLNPTEVSWGSDGILVRLHQEETRLPCFLELARKNSLSRFLAVPPVARPRFIVRLLHAHSTEEPERRLAIGWPSCQTQNPIVDAVLSYVRAGLFSEAVEMFQMLGDFSYEKLGGPFAALSLGYFLARRGELEKLSEFAEHLYQEVNWLPDPAILYAWLLSSQSNRPRLEKWNEWKPPSSRTTKIQELLLLAARRGPPLFTVGLRFLFEKLRMIQARLSADSPLTERVAHQVQELSGRLAAGDEDESLTTFIGISPWYPTLDPRLITPVVEGVSLTGLIPLTGPLISAKAPVIQVDSTHPITSDEYAHSEAVVSTEWVSERLNDPNVRVIESNEDVLRGPIKPRANISLPEDFLFGEVPSKPIAPIEPRLAPPVPIVPPSLGPLTAFVGTWKGSGFNTIFRPNNNKTPTPLPTPVSDSDNVLELNITSETLSFSPSLGFVPNRGSDPQGDIFLNGIPYLQVINDVTNPGRTVGIHVEPGLWMSVPPTDSPSEGPTVVRMGSIPHGTTIEAQGFFSPPIAGPPNIKSVDITPFTTVAPGNVTKNIPFPSQTATNQGTARIPQDLTPFIKAGTITQDMLDNPNSILSNILKSQKIVSTTTIFISTNPASLKSPNPADTLFGGGTDNIAFLLGKDNDEPLPSLPNAQALLMNAVFWIETVEQTITVPVFNPGDGTILINGESKVPGLPFPVFSVTPPVAIPAPRQIQVRSTQIQYSQFVILNFAGLSWPHVSVATLVPADPVVVPDSAFN